MLPSLLDDRATTADKIKSPLSSEITNQCAKSNIRQLTLEDDTERIFDSIKLNDKGSGKDSMRAMTTMMH